MAWVRLDDQFPDHPKVSMAGPLAGWLHVCALAYANRYLTDGFVPSSQVSKLADFSGIIEGCSEVDCRLLAERLVAVGMWTETSGGFLIHNYLVYQPSRASVEELRRQRADAGRKGGKAKPKQTASKNGSKPSSEREAKPNPVPDEDPF